MVDPTDSDWIIKTDGLPIKTQFFIVQQDSIIDAGIASGEIGIKELKTIVHNLNCLLAMTRRVVSNLCGQELEYRPSVDISDSVEEWSQDDLTKIAEWIDYARTMVPVPPVLEPKLSAFLDTIAPCEEESNNG